MTGALAGWSCDPSSPPAHFDGNYAIGRLPIGRYYLIYVEPLDGAVLPSDVANAFASACTPSGPTPCLPPVNTNFVGRTRSAP